MSRLAIFMALAAFFEAGSALSQPLVTDLREFRVGMPLAELPAHGYAELKCGIGAAVIASWSDYRKCPADAAGQYAISFRYDDGGEHETKVAGQPMLLTLMMDAAGVVEALQFRTDPAARLFLRKRGYIFGEQVMARYGDNGWACTQAKPAGGQEPVGGVFVQEHCEKSLASRHLVVDRHLFRDREKPPGTFTSDTTFTVSLVPARDH